MSDLLRTAARGVLGAMAMTGVRRITVDLGLVEKPPPEEIATEGAPALLAKVAPQHRETAIELLHWGTGAMGGMGFAMVPAALRHRRWAGPVYGLAILGVFEAAIAPRLGLGTTERTATERFALAADHVLYGLVLGSGEGSAHELTVPAGGSISRSG
ncbi:MAG: hypothetical protein H0V79_07925 [Actinobacteria bacterium]|nr:hypothetical protein [Actinomycetota bacterium]